MADQHPYRSSSINYYAALQDNPSSDDDTDSERSDDGGTEIGSEKPSVNTSDVDQVNSSAIDVTYRNCKFQNQHYNKDWNSPPADHERLFHQDCPECASVSPLPEEQLCRVCQHLRRRHILRCLRKDPQDSGAYLSFGTLQDLLLSRTSCALRQFLTEVILKHGSQAVARGEVRLSWSNSCFLKLASDSNATGKVNRPGGLNLSLCFQNKPSTFTGSEGVFLHFRCLDESTLSRDDQGEYSTIKTSQLPDWLASFMYHEVEFPTGYSRKQQHKVPSGKDKPPAVALRADTVQPRCNWSVIKGLLHDCLALHKHRNYHTFLGAPCLLIDTHRRCVVNASPGFVYAALSYVWGPDHRLLKCTKSTKERLMRDKSLLHHNIPLTITDAIEVCCKLGLQYLWVDSLCIVQDDPSLRDTEIRRMGDIYSGAFLTIAAVDGTSAHSGLCGVSARVRTQQTAGAFDGLEAFEILPGYESCVIKSPWNDRGWTYQESCLSKRLLLFTEHQVFLRCESHLCFEDPSVGSYGLREWLRFDAPIDIAFGMGSSKKYDTIVYFSQALLAYSSRKTYIAIGRPQCLLWNNTTPLYVYKQPSCIWIARS
jgi:hypothetical protein